MKKSVVLYHIIKDGSFTAIEKTIFTQSAARAALKDYPGDYFRTFKKAKTTAIQYIRRFIKIYKLAIERLNITAEIEIAVIDFTHN